MSITKTLIAAALIAGSPILAQASSCPLSARQMKSDNWQAGTTIYPPATPDITWTNPTLFKPAYGFEFRGAYWEQGEVHCQYYATVSGDLYLSIKHAAYSPSYGDYANDWHKPSIAYELIYCLTSPDHCTFEFK